MKKVKVTEAMMNTMRETLAKVQERITKYPPISGYRQYLMAMEKRISNQMAEVEVA